MEKNLNEIYEGLKGDYFVSDAGDIYRKKQDGIIQPIKANSQNKHDKHIAVKLFVCEGNQISEKHFPVRYVVLNAFRGYRGREFKCVFKDGNTHNVKLNNLAWQLKNKKSTLSLFDVMTDRELKVWTEVLKEIKDITVMRKCHEVWLKEYLAWVNDNTIHNKAEFYEKRYKFFEQLFQKEYAK